ncbi:UNVERIFIED_ORG: hypothetical protein ABIB19_002481 [Arthrobacter sp. UYEF10]
MSFECGCEFEEVRVVERTPDGLPELVLRGGIESAGPNLGCIVAVDVLAHEVRVRMG